MTVTAALQAGGPLAESKDEEAAVLKDLRECTPRIFPIAHVQVWRPKAGDE